MPSEFQLIGQSLLFACFPMGAARRSKSPTTLIRDWDLTFPAFLILFYGAISPAMWWTISVWLIACFFLFVICRALGANITPTKMLVVTGYCNTILFAESIFVLATQPIWIVSVVLHACCILWIAFSMTAIVAFHGKKLKRSLLLLLYPCLLFELLLLQLMW